MIKKLFLISIASLLFFSATAQGQVENPVKWSFTTVSDGGNFHIIKFDAKISGKWHLYDLGPYENGPNPTIFEFETPKGYKLNGGIVMVTKPTVAFDNMFQQNIGSFNEEAKFSQRIEVTSKDSVTIRGYVEWMVCDDGMCLAPTDKEFIIKLPGAKTTAKATDTKVTPVGAEANGGTVAKASIANAKAEANQTATSKNVETTDNNVAATDNNEEITTTADEIGTQANVIPGTIIEAAPVKGASSKSIWGVIIEAIIWGFVALLTPCVFPMVPMTVSFFLKQSQNNQEAEERNAANGNSNGESTNSSLNSKRKSSSSKGKIMATFFGLSIITLYTLPIAAIIVITYFAGGEAVTADMFNWLATHWIPNVLFFLIFMIFAISFFGAFEIVLPSWMVNKSDAKSDKGGYAGVFFMALTLVLVSFSCTGPIVGTILIKSTQGEIWEPIITMFAFSAAFALPFTVFAFAPSLLKDLPKSGGWLNSVKVVLGFIEVALGFKFLSVADQVYHWGLLDREIYLAIWIVVFTLMGLYLLGKLRFAHDSPTQHITVKRLFMAMATFAFVVYMIPGMWGAPLKGLSGYLPPISTQDYKTAQLGDLQTMNVGGNGQGGGTYAVGTNDENGGVSNSANNNNSAGTKGSLRAQGIVPKYSDFLHLAHGLEGFFQYDEALAYAKKVNMPLFVDFTGHGCVNCREMEARVWSDPRVLKILREDYIILALYADDKKTVDESEWVTTESGRVLKSIGKINSEIAMRKYNVNAQPYYAIIDPATEKHMTDPRGYNLDVDLFIEFLQKGKEGYKNRK